MFVFNYDHFKIYFENITSSQQFPTFPTVNVYNLWEAKQGLQKTTVRTLAFLYTFVRHLLHLDSF